MNSSHKSVVEIILTVLSTIVVIIAVTYWMCRVRDKRTLMARMVPTVILALVLIFIIIPLSRNQGLGQIGAVFFTVAWGVVPGDHLGAGHHGSVGRVVWRPL